MRTFFRLLLTLGMTVSLAYAAGGGAVLADPFSGATSQACQGANFNSSTDCSGGSVTLTRVLGDVINLLSLAVGVAAVIMIIIGGLRYVTSGGDSSNTSGAKNTILYALVGLVVALLAQVLVRFVIFKTH